MCHRGSNNMFVTGTNLHYFVGSKLQTKYCCHGKPSICNPGRFSGSRGSWGETFDHCNACFQHQIMLRLSQWTLECSGGILCIFQDWFHTCFLNHSYVQTGQKKKGMQLKTGMPDIHDDLMAYRSLNGWLWVNTLTTKFMLSIIHMENGGNDSISHR